MSTKEKFNAADLMAEVIENSEQVGCRPCSQPGDVQAVGDLLHVHLQLLLRSESDNVTGAAMEPRCLPDSSDLR